MAQIGFGMLALVAIGRDDTPADLDYLAEKLIGLRMFDDGKGKMNQSLIEVQGAILVVSEFTLFADVRGGKRPSFEEAAPAEVARPLYEKLLARIRAAGLVCESGRFQANMQVELVNQGPVTILIDSKRKF